MQIKNVMKWLTALALLWPAMALAQMEGAGSDAATSQTDKIFSVARPHQCAWAYPPAERKSGVSGVAEVQFTIEKGGTVSGISISQSTGNANLDDATLKCVKVWRYMPALQNGQPITVPWKAKIEWNPNATEVPHSCAEFYSGPTPDFDKIYGTTELMLTTVNGGAGKVELVKSSGSSKLDLAALRCAATMRFNIKYVAHRPIDIRGNLNIAWKALLSPPK
ncbi:MAG TPA: energy transducer TonB [Rhizomicrobium sp.]|jgi:TonB family protein|nr:energy transducer TonB [Rhizomicrobium sp.]